MKQGKVLRVFSPSVFLVEYVPKRYSRLRAFLGVLQVPVVFFISFILASVESGWLSVLAWLCVLSFFAAPCIAFYFLAPSEFACLPLSDPFCPYPSVGKIVGLVRDERLPFPRVVVKREA